MEPGKKEELFRELPKLSDGSREILLKELDVLKDLFSGTDSRIEGLFNSYLTFLTAVVGGLVILSQVARLDNYGILQTLSAILLFFIGLVGIMYSVSIAHRYADLYRYAIGVDELRKYLLLEEPQMLLPKIYDDFKLTSQNLKEVPPNKSYWLKSVGTYHMFTVILDSTALAVSVGLILWGKPLNPVAAAAGSILAWGIAYLAQNYYARSNGLLRADRLNLLLNVNRINYVIKKEGERR